MSALKRTNSYSIEYIFSQSAIKDTSTFAQFSSTSAAYRECKMITNKLVYRPYYAAIRMIYLTYLHIPTAIKFEDTVYYRPSVTSSIRVIDPDVNSLQVGGKSLFHGKNEIS